MHCLNSSLPSSLASCSRQKRRLAARSGDHGPTSRLRGGHVCRAEPANSSPDPAGSQQQPLASSSSSLAPAGLSRRGLIRGLVAVGGLAVGTWASTSSAQPSGPRVLSPEEQQALNAVLRKLIDKSRAPGALRLVFHDSGTYSARDGLGGSNASIRFELDRPENKGLKRSWRWVEQASSELRSTAASSLSFADLIALCGAYAVAVCGGPSIPVRVGRVDAAQADPPGRLPGEKFSAQELKDNFAAKGLTTREFLALSGAHTLGSKGFGDAMTFDNVYFKELLKKPWLNTQDPMASMIGLPSDHVLPDDPELVPIIQGYAADEAAFFRDFSAAYVKMTELGASWK